MSESSSDANPRILVNGEQEEQQQQEDHAPAGEDQMSSVILEEEDRVAADKEIQAKMQSAFQQVRNQIRSQVGTKAPKCSMLELMQRVKDSELKTAQVKEHEEVPTDGSRAEMDGKQEELREAFEKKLEARQEALREELEAQISRVRAEMQAYTDQALKDLECKMQSQRPQLQPHPRQQQDGKGPDKNQKPSAPPALASRRGRVLTRTMTTIIPKTCAPVVLGPRARSETLNSSKVESSRLLLRDPALSLPGPKPCQSRKPVLPPAYPPVHQRKKTVRAKPKTGN